MIYVVGPLLDLSDVHRAISRSAGLPAPGQGVDPQSYRGPGTAGWTDYLTLHPQPTTTPGVYAIPVGDQYAQHVPATLPAGVTVEQAVSLVPLDPDE